MDRQGYHKQAQRLGLDNPLWMQTVLRRRRREILPRDPLGFGLSHSAFCWITLWSLQVFELASCPNLTPRNRMLSALVFLDPGERATIPLALAVCAYRLLIDDSGGRAEAERRHLIVTGTVGVLADAHLTGLLDFETALVHLRSTNIYVTDEVVGRVRHRITT
ncbi:MAG: hypothetical protein JO182_25650 [Acidobacteriaceae bacterium]|nr:hypothetical protein [Acidobacteriaceae bacterium]